MKRKPIRVLNVEELRCMHTGSLLSRLAALRRCYETKTEGEEFDSGLIECKQCDRWKTAYRQVKDVLSTREHVCKKTRRMK